MAAVERPINWTNVANVVGATAIVSTEAIGAMGTTGWAVSSLLKLGDQAVVVATIGGCMLGAVAAYFFFRAAQRAEPFR
jgi:hypothetical protein